VKASGHQGCLGDGARIEFHSTGAALECAVNIQRELRRPDPPYVFSEPIQLRAGLHDGDVVSEGGDIFGADVAVATRLQAQPSRAEF
jgi:adenylate cyclase